MELEFTYGQMAISIRANGLKISSMEEARFTMQSVKNTLSDYGNMARPY